MRSIFSLLFTYSLFNRIQSKLTEKHKHFSWSPNVAATVYVLAGVIGSVINQISTQTAASSMFSFISFALLIPMVWSCYKAQQAANIASGDKAGEQNSNITPVNLVWIILGILLWVLLLFGFYKGLSDLSSSAVALE